jgi:hypothetical protein
MDRELALTAASAVSWFIGTIKNNNKAPEQIYSDNNDAFSDLYKQLTETSISAVDSVLGFYKSIIKESDAEQEDRIKKVFSIFVTEEATPEYKNEIIKNILEHDTAKEISREKNITNIIISGVAAITVIIIQTINGRNKQKLQDSRPIKFWEKR